MSTSIAIIPARMGSSRFPGKPLAPLAGIPMIGHVWKRVCLALGPERTFVATCDQVIADYVGPQLRVDMHIDVNGDLPFTRVHQISDAVTERLESLEPVDLVYIHVEPVPPRPGAE